MLKQRRADLLLLAQEYRPFQASYGITAIISVPPMTKTSELENVILPEDMLGTDDDVQTTDEDYALYIVLSDMNEPIGARNRADYVAQLLAVHNMLDRQRYYNDVLQQEMDDIASFIKKTGSWRAIDEWGERFYDSIYQDAAHSMAATGMLAPLIESLFRQSFLGLSHLILYDKTSHPRWTWPEKKRWDCRFYSNKMGKPQTDLVQGVLELSRIIGLNTHMPDDLESVLRALFTYRNLMFHSGIEWPSAKRKNFDKNRASWPSTWFSKSESGGEPWMFYLTDTYIRHCLATIEKIIRGVGAFARSVEDR
jgi:hypothetical protein